MYHQLFYNFLLSQDNFQVFERNELLYSSNKNKLISWLEYIGMFSPYVIGTIIFERLMGNAAALLAVKSGCQKVYSPLASRLARVTLEKYRIKYELIHIVPYIHSDQGDDICPLERL